jgi:hypothetical protein
MNVRFQLQGHVPFHLLGGILIGNLRSSSES